MHKEFRNTLAWIVCATFLMFTAVWQAQVAAKRDLEARRRTLPPPAKTKRAIRPATQAFTGDVVADYIARCEKGMTDQEIGWILEDFHNLGLQPHPWDDIFNDPPNPSFTPAELESFLAYTRAQTRWYREILRDGFRLSPEQSSELSQKLARQLEKSQATFLGLIKSGFPKSYPGGMGGEWTQHWTPWTGLYLDLPDCRPWNLCSLTSSQEKISWKLASEAIESGEHVPSEPISFDANLPVADHRDLYFQNESRLFPILKNQKLIRIPAADSFAEPDEQYYIRKILENTRHLHPAQLKTRLLLDPQIAAGIQQALEAASR